MGMVTVRPVAAADAEAIATIYNEGIEDRVATFETRLRTVDEIADCLAAPLPFLVAVEDGVVLGFARVSAVLRPLRLRRRRRARRIRRACGARRGLGVMLLARAVRGRRGAGLYKLTSRIFTDNEASRAVHVAAGFEEVGIQRRHGRLDGEWKDCVLVERLLGDAAR